MGAKTWMLVYADRGVDPRVALSRSPVMDRDAAHRLASVLFPRERLKPLGEVDLTMTCPDDHELCVGAFPGLSIIAAGDFGLDRPSTLPQRFIEHAGGGTLTLHAMHSVVDWFAFAQWTGGRLTRSLSLAPDHGVLEDIGDKLPFEEPYWAGRHPALDDEKPCEYPFPFHPLELSEAALGALFGYHLEGEVSSSLVDPGSIPLLHYARSRPFWKFWR